MHTSNRDLARYIDHTLLAPDASSEQIKALCTEAVTYGFYGVCVNSCFIKLAAEKLAGTAAIPISVVGFPLGAMATEAKVFETQWAIRCGAREIDMVANLGCLKSVNYIAYELDIRSVVAAAHPWPVKVILETAALNREEIIKAATLAKHAGAHFVKSSTGFSKAGGATIEAIQLLRATVGPKMGIKASGGIRSAKDAWAFIAAGANRIGSSNSVAMVS
jgi:deoxyribose-phosphate aldolase